MAGNIKGPVTYWYENGNKKLVENYLDNLLHGLVIRYDKKGKKNKKQKYLKGLLKEEKLYNYHDEGQIESTNEYIFTKDGQVENEIITRWTTSGKLISKLNNGFIWKGKVTKWWDEE